MSINSWPISTKAVTLPRITFLPSKKGGRIVGAASTRPSPYQPGQLWMVQISVAAACKGREYGKSLLREIFRDAADKNCQLLFSYFMPQGFARLACIAPRLHKDFPALSIQYMPVEGNPAVTGRDDYRLEMKGNCLSLRVCKNAPG